MNDDVLMVKASEAARRLSLDLATVYELAAAGRLEKRYIGKGTREFRLSVASLKAYVDSLPTEPVEEVT